MATTDSISHVSIAHSADTSCSFIDGVLDAINPECASRHSDKQIHELIDMWSASIDNNERTDLLSSIVPEDSERVWDQAGAERLSGEREVSEGIN